MIKVYIIIKYILINIDTNIINNISFFHLIWTKSLFWYEIKGQNYDYLQTSLPLSVHSSTVSSLLALVSNKLCTSNKNATISPNFCLFPNHHQAMKEEFFFPIELAKLLEWMSLIDSGRNPSPNQSLWPKRLF